LLPINRLLPASGRQPQLRWLAMTDRRRLAGAGLEGNQAGRSNLRKARASQSAGKPRTYRCRPVGRRR